MTDRPQHRRERADDARAIPQRPRGEASAPTGSDPTRAIPQGSRGEAGRPAAARSPAPPPAAPDPYRTRPIATTPPAYAARPAAPVLRRGAAPAGPPTGPPPLPPRREGGLPRPPRPRHPVRRLVSVVVLIAVAWICGTAWALNATWSSVGRVGADPAAGHIADTAGRNVLMVGSDARTGLTPAQRKELGTGFTEGARTDSIMVLHTGSGDPTLLSIPRDSYVEVPGHGKNKINAAFAIGGPALLTETVEKATGLRIDGYLEIGFGGFASLVDSVGGVRMCLPGAMKDEKAHIDLPKGCQVLNGKNALGYVRARYSDPEGDLGRVKRQRLFLGALMGKLATPANVLLPWRLHRVGTSGSSAITIGDHDGIYGTFRAFQGLRAVAGTKGNSVTVPVADAGLQTPAGLAVQWDDAKAAALFDALRDDLPLTVAP